MAVAWYSETGVAGGDEDSEGLISDAVVIEGRLPSMILFEGTTSLDEGSMSVEALLQETLYLSSELMFGVEVG